MAKPFKGTINIDVRDSVPDWEPYEQPTAPAGVPNVIVLVWDDDRPVGEFREMKTQVGKFALTGEGLNIGRDGSAPVTDDYPGRPPWAFGGGVIRKVIMDLSGEAYLDLVTAGFATAMGAAVAADPDGQAISASVANQLQKSFAGAEAVAQQYPQYASQITAAAKASFLAGDQWAYLAGIIAILIGAALVAFAVPKPDDERRLLAAYHAQDAAQPVAATDTSVQSG